MSDGGVYITQDVERAAELTKLLLSVWDQCREATRDELISSVVEHGGFVSTADDPLSMEDLMLLSVLSATMVLTMEHLQISSRESRWILFGNTVDQRLTFAPTEWLIEAIDAINQRETQKGIESILDGRRN
jgi:hypothetical protein